MGKWVGKAHNKLKLFLHIACSVPNHMNRISTPIKPTKTKKKTNITAMILIMTIALPASGICWKKQRANN